MPQHQVTYNGRTFMVPEKYAIGASSGDLESKKYIHDAYTMQSGPTEEDTKEATKSPVEVKGMYKAPESILYPVGAASNRAVDAAEAFATALSPSGTRNDFYRGGTNAIRGGLDAMSAFAPEAMMAHPVYSALSTALGYGTGKGAEAATEYAGGSPEAQEFAGTVGNVAGGIAGGSPKTLESLKGATGALKGKNLISRVGPGAGIGGVAGMLASKALHIPPYEGGIAGAVTGNVLANAPEMAQGAAQGFKQAPWLPPALSKFLGMEPSMVGKPSIGASAPRPIMDAQFPQENPVQHENVDPHIDEVPPSKLFDYSLPATQRPSYESAFGKAGDAGAITPDAINYVDPRNQQIAPQALTPPSGKPIVPETGIPENVARANDARETLTQQIYGRNINFADLSNSDRNAIDDLVSQGHGFANEPPADLARKASPVVPPLPQAQRPGPIKAPLRSNPSLGPDDEEGIRNVLSKAASGKPIKTGDAKKSNPIIDAGVITKPPNPKTKPKVESKIEPKKDSTSISKDLASELEKNKEPEVKKEPPVINTDSVVKDIMALEKERGNTVTEEEVKNSLNSDKYSAYLNNHIHAVRTEKGMELNDVRKEANDLFGIKSISKLTGEQRAQLIRHLKGLDKKK